MTGAPGGLELVKRFGAKYWLSAHDEPKDNKGVVVKWIKTKVFGEEDVRKLVEFSGTRTKALGLEVGGSVRIAG